MFDLKFLECLVIFFLTFGTNTKLISFNYRSRNTTFPPSNLHTVQSEQQKFMINTNKIKLARCSLLTRNTQESTIFKNTQERRQTNDDKLFDILVNGKETVHI